MVQTGISNFVSLLDNVMVGRIGTEQMSGVAIVNQLIFVFYLCVMGGLAGAGIFTAQYYGSKNMEGVRHTFRFKLWMGLVLFMAALVIFGGFGTHLIGLYLHGGGNVEATMDHAMAYLHIILIGLPAYAVVQIYANTLRECGETVLPMKAGVAAVVVNLIFNMLLIYGFFGFPALGVRGAAIATSLSRFVEMGIVVSWTHGHPDRCPYAKGLYRSLTIPGHLVAKFIVTGIPLLVNEGLWSSGMAMLAQCYSMRGLDVVAGQNIASTISNVFNVVFFAMGDAIAIIVGQHLGAGRYEEARDEDTKIIAFSVFVAALVGAAIAASAQFFPRLYNTTPNARRIAAHFLIAQGIFTPKEGFLHTSYFTLRSGGRTLVTFVFDSLFMWIVSVPLAFILSRFTSWYVIWIFVALQLADFIKCAIGFVLVRKGVWMQNII